MRIELTSTNLVAFVQNATIAFSIIGTCQSIGSYLGLFFNCSIFVKSTTQVSTSRPQRIPSTMIIGSLIASQPSLQLLAITNSPSVALGGSDEYIDSCVLLDVQLKLTLFNLYVPHVLCRLHKRWPDEFYAKMVQRIVDMGSPGWYLAIIGPANDPIVAQK